MSDFLNCDSYGNPPSSNLKKCRSNDFSYRLVDWLMFNEKSTLVGHKRQAVFSYM